MPWLQKACGAYDLSYCFNLLCLFCQKQTGVPVKCNSCCVPGLSVENEESSTSRDMTRGVLPYMNGLDPESTNSESSMN